MCIVVVHTKRKSNNFFQWNNFIYTSASRKHYTFYHHLHYWYKVIYYFVLGILRTAIHPKVFTTNIGELRLWINFFLSSLSRIFCVLFFRFSKRVRFYYTHSFWKSVHHSFVSHIGSLVLQTRKNNFMCDHCANRL